MSKKINIYKQHYSEENKLMYTIAKYKYKEICNEIKLEYYNGNIEQLNKVKSWSNWWKLSNYLKTQKVLEHGNLYSDDFKILR